MIRLVKAPSRTVALGLCAILAVALGACGQQVRPGVRPALVQQIGNERQIDDVIAALKLGDVKRARKMLKEMARRDPADRRVVTLREGLDGDPDKLLGAIFFTYRVESGEQLTTLSQRFLGDRLKFYLLARYNRLKVDALQTGQLIRIPGFAPIPKPRAEPRPDPRPNYRPDVRPTPSPTARPSLVTPSPPALNPAAAGQLRRDALAALNRGAVANGVLILRRAHALDPANVTIKNDLARAERLLVAVRARR